MRLTTERLVLAPFDTERDWVEFVRSLVLDPTVTEHWSDFADPALTDADKVRIAADELLPWFEAGRVQGLIVWTVRERDGAFVGTSGLMTPEPPVGGDAPEFGCLLATRSHGQGYATEAGRAVIEDAWSRLDLPRVITVLDSPNPASRRLVDKLGFRFDRAVFGDAAQAYLVFEVDRPTPGSGATARAG